MTRRHCQHEGLGEKQLAADPVDQFAEWFRQADESGVPEFKAMVLSTADGQGRPSSRTVLLTYGPDGDIRRYIRC